MNVLLSVFLSFLLQSNGGRGSINVLVVDSTGTRPLAGSFVSLSKVISHKGDEKSEEIASKKTDAHGVARFKDILPGDYLLVAAIPESGKSSWKFGNSVSAHVTADSTVKIVITMKPSIGKQFSDEPKYRMKIVPPDTLHEEEMPIYNPDKRNTVPDDSL